MARRRGPLFLKRRSYRLRRLRDAARLLPVLGAFLFLLPLMWARDGAGRTASDGLYLFAVWIGLVVIAAALAPGLGSDGGAADEAEDGLSEGDREPR